VKGKKDSSGIMDLFRALGGKVIGGGPFCSAEKGKNFLELKNKIDLGCQYLSLGGKRNRYAVGVVRGTTRRRRKKKRRKIEHTTASCH